MISTRQNDIFNGCMPALMTPCSEAGVPDISALVKTGQSLIRSGMDAVVYCGSMGDWPLLTDSQRQLGVSALVEAGLPVVVGTGAQNTQLAVEHTLHARSVGAVGLMLLPRVLSRGNSPDAQKEHFRSILKASGGLPAVIYNSPYYGFETQAPLFFELHREFSNLVGFKEFGGCDSLTYAAEHITSGNENLTLMVGVDTQVIHGYLNCGAKGAITGVGNAFPQQILRLVELCKRAVAGDNLAKRYAYQLNEALSVLSKFDEGPDLVLYYKHLMVLEGNAEYKFHFNATDALTSSQQAFIEEQWQQFKLWWKNWPGSED